MSKHNQQIDGIQVETTIPENRQDILKWNGWGYNDSRFIYSKENDEVSFTGNRYPIGNLRLPHLMGWAKTTLNIDFHCLQKPCDLPSDREFPESKISQENITIIQSFGIKYSVKGIDRLMRAHGQTLNAIYLLRTAPHLFPRIPDIVVFPCSHAHIVSLVSFANENDHVIIPFGGGTAVSGSSDCPAPELRPIIALDTTQMNRILHIDRENLLVYAESGVTGQDLERALRQHHLTTGHEPDSYEFSTLGGWVATRASGMKKNSYGNIEDLLVHVKMVTPLGVLEKGCNVPRLSAGPDFHHIILGSEGSLGVVTEVAIKVRPLPECRRFGSMVFPNFENGIGCMREVARRRLQPASIRLMDNGQFKFGVILKPDAGLIGGFLDAAKKLYVTKIKGFNVDEMCVMTLLFEGEDRAVREQEKLVYEIGKQFGGMPAGETNGERGYMLTFVIAYIRDLALDYGVVAESFETSVPWDKAGVLCDTVKRCIAEECHQHNINYFMINCRVTQTYDSGCVIYFYLAFNYANISDPVKMHHMLETHARDQIVACGGSISHHHGVGKLRKKWYLPTVSQVGVDLYSATKKTLDPNNIFAVNNFLIAKL